MSGGREEWRTDSDRFQCDDDEVHVWRAHLPDFVGLHETFRRTLSPEERQRAARFRMSRDRERFVLCRGLLRHLLGRYLSIPPDGFELSYGTWGKPSLARDRGSDTLSFNTSHSGNKVVYAITPHRPVGIDIERCDAAVDYLDIMRLFFSPDETASLMALEQDEQRETFFSLWTCKEAYVKAVGKGLQLPVNRVRISFSRPGIPVLVETEENCVEYGPWSLVSLSPYAGFKAALAFPGRQVRLEYRDGPSIL